ncbi:hypothetical protein BHF71_09075 [Vulcanibacillus modesticaldus]|uniref:FHA domain-containing protein n=1 Tax=Vulcanibacillus modesticaldus TaxID=337097 RepID=A0A1D2YUV6_9BACI|nr:DUF6382 domain-containing protein [Vulcanibacillus modesticaldus]OEF99453.1 hypothetical protein BHF71_09075 [Vulcanibacillus modesticaldus]
MNEIYKLNFDYINQNGHFLIFSKDEGIREADLSNIQIKMLLANPIPNLLPLGIDEIDFKISLRYEITSKKMLVHFFKRELLSEDQFYQLLLNIVSTISDSKMYMLNEQNYILRQDFIYIGQNINDIYLTYLPLKQIESKKSVFDDLKQLVLGLYHFVENIENDKFQELIAFMSDAEFVMSDLKQKLLDLLEQNFQQSKNTPSDNNNLVVNEEQPDLKPSLGIKDQHNSEINRLVDKKNLLFILILVIGIIIWGFYYKYPSEFLFYTSVGLTIIIFFLPFVYWNLHRAIEEKKVTTIDSENEIDYYEKLPNNTTLLTKQDETIFLNENLLDDLSQNPLSKAYLEVKRGSKTERIEIIGQNFLIGRNPATVDYVENSRGISRVHLEILKLNYGYVIRDLGSKNGSFLNKQQLTPNKIYPLEDGDILKLAKTEFKFEYKTS